jgi:lysozyme family protein
MHSSYDDALKRLLAHEGGYTNDAADPGGPTNFGITIYDYRKYVKPGATAADVRAMSLADAKGIYRSKYWRELRCDELPAGVDDSVFDYGVNSGVARAGKVLRRVLGMNDNDWHVTDAVLAAVRQRDPARIIHAIARERLHFLQGLRTWPVFGRGWGRRVAEVEAFDLKLAARTAAPVPIEPAFGKGQVAPPPPSPSRIAAKSGAALAASGTLAHTGAGTSLLLTIAIVALAIAAIGIIAWLRARWHARQQEAPTADSLASPAVSSPAKAGDPVLR